MIDFVVSPRIIIGKKMEFLREINSSFADCWDTAAGLAGDRHRVRFRTRGRRLAGGPFEWRPCVVTYCAVTFLVKLAASARRLLATAFGDPGSLESIAGGRCPRSIFHAQGTRE